MSTQEGDGPQADRRAVLALLATARASLDEAMRAAPAYHVAWYDIGRAIRAVGDAERSTRTGARDDRG
jgi:hypothetical protein